MSSMIFAIFFCAVGTGSDYCDPMPLPTYPSREQCDAAREHMGFRDDGHSTFRCMGRRVEVWH